MIISIIIGTIFLTGMIAIAIIFLNIIGTLSDNTFLKQADALIKDFEDIEYKSEADKELVKRRVKRELILLKTKMVRKDKKEQLDDKIKIL